MNARLLLPFAVLGALLAACSGGATLTSSGGSPDGGTGTDGGACSIDALEGKRVCVPGTAKAGVAITIEAEADSCIGCGTTMEPCKVEVTGNAIRVSVEAKSCPLPPETACPAVCGIPRTTCKLPPLQAGTYSVEVAAANHKGPRELVVTADAKDDACTLTQDGTAPTLAASAFPQTCTVDADCALVQEGNACAVCACPNAGIAKSATDAWKAAARAAKSDCPMELPTGIACAACAPMTAKCDAGTCKAVLTSL